MFFYSSKTYFVLSRFFSDFCSQLLKPNVEARKKLNGIWNALSAVKLKPAIYAKIPDV